jgi:diguanylate cyclase
LLLRAVFFRREIAASGYTQKIAINTAIQFEKTMNNNSEDKQNWREKYLDALDNQDLLEQKLKEQQELLRRALVSISVAADGQDDTLDQLMADLREGLRGGRPFNLSQWLTRLEPAAVQVEQQRGQSTSEMSAALTSVVNVLMGLKLPRPVKKEMNDYLDQLPQRIKKVRLYPALLEQLAELQRAALQSLEQPKPAGLLQKILPGKNPGQDKPPVEHELDGHDLGIDPTWLQTFNNLLQEFLIGLEGEPQIQSRLNAIREQLQEDSSPEQALVKLKQVRNLVVDAYLAANRAFATYLDQVNAELGEIYTLVGGAAKHSAAGQSASHQLQVDMAREMANLERGAAEATDLTQLKQQVIFARHWINTRMQSRADNNWHNS